ncbi:Hypothetical predicted protein, partial [Paramuricea clavata]
MAEKSEQKYFTSDEVLQNILADEADLSDNEDAQVITTNPAEAIDSAVRELWSLRNQTANFVAFEEESTRSLTSLFDKWEKHRVIQERILSSTIIAGSLIAEEVCEWLKIIRRRLSPRMKARNAWTVELT